MQNGSYGGPREDTLPNAVIQEDSNWTALHEAASTGDDKKVQTILSTSADFTAKEAKHGNTPLHEAAWRGFSRCVKALCAPPNNTKKIAKDKKIKGCISETRGALHSALLGIKNNGGFSALHLAAQNGHNQSCREILLAGADPDVQNNYGDTPLHTACRYGHAGATRILISATCDPNKNNLNGDTPLHIAAAMGRRKLTRILLEADANTDIKNGQNESPRDIATRKHFTEIIDILNQSKSKPSKSNKTDRRPNVDDVKSSRRKKSKTADRTDCAANPINWSPYGCHYFPDPRTFPSPKLETLPKEPLKNGEQYFLDLGGNIRKGPVGVGNTCYCGPFFKHIEEKISRNRKSIRKYVHKAAERIDNKVQELALKTDDQIEQLTRSMLADRIRCEGRRMHLEHWLKRGEAYRVTTGTQSKSKKNFDNVNTLTRCKSLDILDDDSVFSNRLSNSRSFDVLQGVNVTVHRNPEPSDDEDSLTSIASFGQRTSKNSENSRNTQNDGQWDGIGMEADYYSVSERLEELLAKTNEILEMEKEASRRRKDELLAFSDDSVKKREISTQRQSRNHRGFFTNDILDQLRKTSLTENQIFNDNQTSSKEHQSELSLSPLSNGLQTQSPESSGNNYVISEKELERKSDIEHERSSVLSGSSQHHQSFLDNDFPSSFSHIHHQQPTSSGTSQLSNNSTNASAHSHNLIENSNTSLQYENIAQMHESKNTLQNVITALRKDHNMVREIIQAELLKENDIEEEENASYTDEQTVLNGFFENTCFVDAAESSNNTLKSEKASTAVSASTEPDQLNTTKQKKSRISSAKNWLRGSISSSKDIEDVTQRVNGTVKNVEIKNSEIKSLKKTPVGKLKRSKVQELVARIQGKLMSSSKTTEESSESSEDEQNEQNENLNAPAKDFVQGASNYYYNRAQPQIPSTSIVLGANNNNQSTLNNYQPNQFVPGYENKTPVRHINTQHLIPKDAYFHKLPNKNRSLSQSQEQTVNSNNFYFPQSNPQFQQQQQQQQMQQIQQIQQQQQIPQHRHIQFQNSIPQHAPILLTHNANELSARTRNPLLYPQGLEPNFNKNYVNSPYFQALNEMEHPLNPEATTATKNLNQNEKLLSNRKFAYASGLDLKFPTVLQNKCNQMYQQFAPTHILPTTSVSISPVEQQTVERDMSNDSGFSTKIYESSHRPSPTLSGTALPDYGGLSQLSPPICSQSTNDDDNIPYFIGNSSSLV